MGIISKIKSVLGVTGDGQERSRDRNTAATVDAEPETTTERAVKGGDQGPASTAERQSDAAAGPVTDDPSRDESGSDDRGDTPDETRTGDPDDGAGEATGASDEPVDTIKGIGSAYAERLADAGVDSVSELARADPEELASATDLGTGRVGKWIERARARTETSDR